MSDLAKKFAEEAFLLPREDRAELVNALLESLNLQTQAKIDNLWAEESEKRVREYEDGKVKAVNGEKVFKEIKKRLGN